jgi:type VI secretion system protein ImpH
MAGKDRGAFSDLRLDLLKEGHTFSFYQVIRLLRSFASADGGTGKTDSIRIRPELSLNFPPADVDRIEELSEDDIQFLVTVTFLGLYGPSSPLPTFYTEDLMDEASDDESVTREFVDILNHRIFLLLFKCWAKYRQFFQVVEEKDADHMVRLFSLFGLGEEALREDVPDAYGLLRYLGILTQFPRSALGLKTLLQDSLGKIPVEIVPCVLSKVRIPEDQRLFMGISGSYLGQDSFVGEEIEDRMGKFRIKIGPLRQKEFQGLLPGGEYYEKLTSLTNFYVTDPLEYDVELTLAEKEAQGVCLGQPEWSRLGLDTWVFTGEEIGEVSATFYPE